MSDVLRNSPAAHAPAAAKQKAPPPWPPLRDELRLSPGPSTTHGSPGWIMHDPAAHRFFRIGWLEFEVLSRWALGSAGAIQSALMRETTLAPPLEMVQAVYDFALRNSLITAATPQDTERLVQMKQFGKSSFSHKILHGYLFLRLPLLAPDAWLGRNLPKVRWMFSRAFFLLLLCFSLLGVYLISREWVRFLLHIDVLWSWQHSIVVVCALGLAKTIHELGHAFAAKHLGLRVPRMGIALMCFMPVLWTDVTEAWKLPRRADRLLVDLSGVGAELTLATLASLLWPLLPPGAAKSAVLTLAGTTWLATLAVNGNPFMRYDGYYILSDYWEIPGLQQRAFALGRWYLRELVFGFGDPPPEAFPSGTKGKLLLYAYGTWIYRFFLFLGIALLVYHLFFKILGLALMLVEVVWFVALPIYKELLHWYSRRGAVRLTWQTLRSGLFLLGAIVLFVVPWHTHVEGMGLFSAQRMAVLYAQQPAMVKEIHVQPGEQVATGQVLLSFSSPELDARLQVARRKLAILRDKLALSSLDPELRFSYESDMQEMHSVASELANLENDKRRLKLTAPFDGVFRDMPTWVVPGVWVPEKTKLGVIVDSQGLVTAYVAEEDMERLATGMTGLFYPISGFFPPIGVRVIEVAASATRDISQPELPTSIRGGVIPARKTPGGRIAPEQALYKIVCRVESGPMPSQSVSGRLSISATRRSFAGRFWQAALGVLIRESGLD